MDTEAKIIAFLSVRPQTSEELWKNTRIHKNTMVKRLAELVERNHVIKHRYAFAYNDRNYGILYDLNYGPTAKDSRVYYLLNCSSYYTKTRLGSYFKNPTLRECVEDTSLMASAMKAYYEIFEYKLIEKNLNPLLELTNKMSSSLSNDDLSKEEGRKLLIDLITHFLTIHRKRLEIDFELVQNGIDFTRSGPIDLEVISKVINHYSETFESIFDIIIRIMTDPIWIGWPKTKLQTDLQGYRYTDLWDILKKENYLPQDLKLNTPIPIS